MAQTATEYAATLAKVHALRSAQPISTLLLADPIITSTAHSRSQQTASAEQEQQQQQQRDSDASNSSSSDHLTPTTLNADLTHYRELFSKLRFSYLEQVTKEKYLRSIVGDPPILVSHADNLALEDELAVQKEGLRAKKRAVEELVAHMDTQARELAGMYERVNGDVKEMERLVPLVAELEKEKAELEKKLEEKREKLRGEAGRELEEDPRMQLSLAQTAELVQVKEQENRDLDNRIAELQWALPGKMRECEAVERELEGLERRRDESAAAAREARMIKEEGGRDRVEEMGRWYRSAEVVLNGLGIGGTGGNGRDMEVKA